MRRNALIIIGRMPYPVASAPVNRAHLYCKALLENEVQPLMVNLHSPFKEPQNFNYLGRFEGVPFIYSEKHLERIKSLFLRNIYKLKSLWVCFGIILKFRKKYNLNILFFTCGSLNEIILGVFLKILHIPILKEQNEIPTYIRNPDNKILLHKLSEKIHVRIYDKMILISENLISYYKNKFDQAQILHIPVLVDLKRFDLCFIPYVRTRKVLTYVGYMGGNKDGLLDLIEAVNILTKLRQDFLIQLIGTASLKELVQLKTKVNDLNITDYISFLGSKDGKEIPELLLQSDYLLLARPNNLQAKFGFPTKLGEYLASGKPVIVTDTGEICKFLTHGVSAFIAKPSDPLDFANKILEAMTDSKLAEIVGKNGRNIAEKYFDYHLYGKILLNIFIQKN